MAEMPRHCAAAGCRGNYRGEPSTSVVKFPKDVEQCQKWIEAMSNDPESLKHLKEIWICASHFDCEWEKTKDIFSGRTTIL